VLRTRPRKAPARGAPLLACRRPLQLRLGQAIVATPARSPPRPSEGDRCASDDPATAGTVGERRVRAPRRRPVGRNGGDAAGGKRSSSGFGGLESRGNCGAAERCLAISFRNGITCSRNALHRHERVRRRRLRRSRALDRHVALVLPAFDVDGVPNVGTRAGSGSLQRPQDRGDGWRDEADLAEVAPCLRRACDRAGVTVNRPRS